MSEVLPIIGPHYDGHMVNKYYKILYHVLKIILTLLDSDILDGHKTESDVADILLVSVAIDEAKHHTHRL